MSLLNAGVVAASGLRCRAAAVCDADGFGVWPRQFPECCAMFMSSGGIWRPGIIAVMRIAPVPGGEFGLQVGSVDHETMRDPAHTIATYRGTVTVDGFRFRATVSVGGYALHEWNPNGVWAQFEPDLSDPAVIRVLRMAAKRACERGFRAASPSMKYSFECWGCRGDRAHIKRFRESLLLSGSAGVYVFSTMTVGTRADEEDPATDTYDHCLIHGDQVHHDASAGDPA